MGLDLLQQLSLLWDDLLERLFEIRLGGGIASGGIANGRNALLELNQTSAMFYCASASMPTLEAFRAREAVRADNAMVAVGWMEQGQAGRWFKGDGSKLLDGKN